MVDKSIVTTEVVNVSGTAADVGSVVPTGAKRYVTRVTVTDDDATNPVGVSLYEGATTGAETTMKLFLYADDTTAATNVLVEAKCDSTGVLFVIDSAKYLTCKGDGAYGFATITYYDE